MTSYSIAVLAGDGIGPEVIDESVKALKAIAQRFGHQFELAQALVGQAAIDIEGISISEDTVQLCHRADAILFGAVGGGTTGDPSAKTQPEHALFRLRKEFELFANVRPIKPFQALLNASTIRAEVLTGVDMVVVRELTGGLYYGRPSEIGTNASGTYAVDTMVYTEAEIERILRYAFALARSRRQHVTSVDKANVLSCSRLWRRTADRLAEEFPDVTLRHLLVDACSMNLIRQPREFDVIVTENMFGDILTDEASMITGSMGMLPSASLGTRQTAHGRFGLFEPIHGTAPDITGQHKANPLAAILTAAMLLRYSLRLTEEADAIENAVAKVVDSGLRTPDIFTPGGSPVDTVAMGDAVSAAILAG